MEKLQALSLSAEANRTSYQYNHIESQLLERFPNPVAEHQHTELRVTMHEEVIAPEFTCLCPITGQPDFARVIVTYRPDLWCFESKAFKLYLGTFRNVGTFHESAAHRILLDLVQLVRPIWMMVDADYAPRGGIAFRPRACFNSVPSELLYAKR